MQEDDFGDDERVIVRTPAGRAMILPKSVGRLSAEAQEVYADVQRAALEIQRLEAQIGADVPAARALGLSWSVIGAALGITGEGARKRYGGATDEG